MDILISGLSIQGQVVLSMRIKAVLRDNDILAMEPGSQKRIEATAMKNLDRIVSQSSLLKVMGLNGDERVRMLETLSNKQISIWLGKDAQQDIIYFTQEKLPEEIESSGYQWQ